MASTLSRGLVCVAATLGASAIPGVSGHAVAQRTSVDTTASSVKIFCCTQRHLVPTAIEIGALQVLPWYVNRHVADDSTAALSLGSWGRNLSEGFEWDPNKFPTNMFLHPIHGNVYFNAARSNGYNFFESSAFAWLGSFVWEMFGENNRGAINDWVNTSMGGIALGEALHRSSQQLLDNQATGAPRSWREIGAFLLNPVGGFSRLFRGEMTGRGSNPAQRDSAEMHASFVAGVRSVADGDRPESGRTIPYVDMSLEYGDHMRDFANPFDAFSVNVQMNLGANPLGRLQLDGTLMGKVLKEGEGYLHVLGVDQHYDYISNETYEVGGQSFGVTLRSRFRLSDGAALRTLIEPFAAVIWAVSSEYATVTGRDYDFGSGAGLRLRASLNRTGYTAVQARYTGVFAHTLSGAAGNHLLHLFGLNVRVPIYRGLGVGMDYVQFVRNSFYRDFPAVNSQNPQFRISLAMFL